jgi:hypothetical protein
MLDLYVYVDGWMWVSGVGLLFTRPTHTHTLLFSSFHFHSSNDISFIILVYVPIVAKCAAATCANFTPCSPLNLACSCFSVSTGGGICGSSRLCSSLVPCDNKTLTCNDSQSVCIVNTCCVIPVCMPLMYAGESVCPTNYSNSSCNR